MSDILLAKPCLPPDWIDVSVGEPHIVKEKLLNVFSVNPYELPPNVSYEYPTPTGYKPLIQLLEEKHKAPVIITNGAKQALGACFYALRQMGKTSMGMKLPYWALIPPLAKMHGMNCVTYGPDTLLGEEPWGFDSYLLLAPNNPDGYCPHADDCKLLAARLKERNIPLIHDAAYYTHVYLPGSHPLPAFGDVQIFSISKMLGLSGLRLGYVVCHNLEFYKLIQQYMEAMTVGVSIVSQVFLHDLMHRMRGYPTLSESFEGMSSMALTDAKRIIKQVDSDVLQVPQNIEETPGMFGWFKIGPAANFDKSKINIIAGSLFGGTGMVRMNLAFSASTMEEIVKRLNSVKE